MTNEIKLIKFREYLVDEVMNYQKRENEYELQNNEKLSAMCMLRGRTVNKIIDKFDELFKSQNDLHK